MRDQLTIVVTSHQRADRLTKCLASIPQGFPVVVSGSATTDAVAKVVKEFGRATATLRAHDLGVNETWLRGVYLARTPYVLILHDDDWLSPNFGETYDNIIAPQLLSGTAGWVLGGADAYDDDGKLKFRTREFDRQTGVMGPAKLAAALYVHNRLAISPVNCIYERDLCVRTLKDFERRFKGPGCATSPTMLAGNDLLLMLRHVETFGSLLYVNEPLACYGIHEGSTTWSHIQSRKQQKLADAYNYTRRVTLRDEVCELTDTAPTPFIHIAHSLPPKLDSRHSIARGSWRFLLERPEVMSHQYAPDMLARHSGSQLGDERPVPFLRDLLDATYDIARPEDWLIYANADIGFSRVSAQRFLDALSHHPEVCYFYRRQIPVMSDQVEWISPEMGAHDGGVDAFAIKASIWPEFRRYLPDFVIGREGWDFCVRPLMNYWCRAKDQPAPDVDNTIWHHPHVSHWLKSTERTRNPGNRHNLRTLDNWVKTHPVIAGNGGMVIPAQGIEFQDAPRFVPGETITTSGEDGLILSVCITCMDRADVLETTLPANLESAAGLPVEFVVMDYSSHAEDAVKDLVKRMREKYPDARLRAYRHEGEQYWQPSHAKNMAHKHARGPVVCNLDADTFLDEHAQAFLIRNVRKNAFVAPQISDMMGTIAFHKDDFGYLGGYDERFNKGYGHEDSDLVARALRSEMCQVELPPTMRSRIHHDSSKRVSRTRIKDYRKAYKAHRDLFLKGDVICANAGQGWGRGEVVEL